MDPKAFVAGMSALGAGMAMIAGLALVSARVMPPVRRAPQSAVSRRHRAISPVP